MTDRKKMQKADADEIAAISADYRRRFDTCRIHLLQHLPCINPKIKNRVDANLLVPVGSTIDVPAQLAKSLVSKGNAEYVHGSDDGSEGTGHEAGAAGKEPAAEDSSQGQPGGGQASPAGSQTVRTG